MPMKREVTNVIRTILDEWVPPVIRDSRFFMWPFFCLAYRFRNIREVMQFKSRVCHFSEQEYEDFYANLNSLSRHRQTDLTERCIEEIIHECQDASQVLDAGCSAGYLLKRLHQHNPALTLSGCDVLPSVTEEGFSYRKNNLAHLDYPDNAFDTVTCCHTLEHVLDLRLCVSELRRVTAKKLIIVVPRQRYYFYTLDEHLHFFPSDEQLLLQMGFRANEVVRLENLSGDWLLVIDTTIQTDSTHSS